MLKTGKRRSLSLSSLHNYNILDIEKGWKRMVTKVTYVGEGFTRKPPKYERFIRPMVGDMSM